MALSQMIRAKLEHRQIDCEQKFEIQMTEVITDAFKLSLLGEF